MFPLTPDQSFQLANALVLPQWLLMMFAPRWGVTQFLVKSYLVPVLLAVLYMVYLFGGGPMDFSAFGTLEGVKSLFKNGGDGVVLAGWIHYLAFDLVAGSVVMRDAQERNISFLLVVVPLLFCFMFGPVGLLLYWVIRTVSTRQIS
jgi:hypothetical protein